MFSFSHKKKNIFKVAVIFTATLLCLIELFCFSDMAHAAGVKKVIVGFYEGNDNFQHGFSDDERKTGYAYEYYQELLKYTDWKYEYFYGSEDEIKTALYEGKIDIAAGIPKTEAVSEQLLFPNTPMGAEGIYIYCPPSQIDRYGKRLSFAGIKIACLSNSTMRGILEDYQNTLPTKFRIQTYPNEEARDKAFENGETRLVVASDNMRPYNTKAVVKIGSIDFYFAIAKDRNDLLGDLNVAQTKLLEDNPTFHNYLSQKYFVNKKSSDGIGSAEKQFFINNEFVIGTLKKMMPYSDLDTVSDSPAGLIRTIAAEFDEASGREIKVVFYDSYDQMLSALKNNEVSCIFPVDGDVWSAEKEGIYLSSAIANDRTSIVFKGVYNYRQDEVVAIPVQSSVSDEYLREKFGQSITIKKYKSVEECIKAVEKGEVELFVCGSSIINRYLSENKLSKSIQVVYTDDEIEYCVGVKDGQNKLISVINKVLSLIDDSVKDEAVITNAYVKAKFDLRDFVKHYSGVIVGIIIVILITILAFTITRSRSIKEHNRELNALNSHLKDNLSVIKAQRGVMRIDSLTQVNNRFRLEEYLNEIYSAYDPFGKTALYMAVMDLDHFKAINDTFGHAEGDEALVITAGVLKKACNGTSIFLARFGGDEFVMLCEADNRLYFDRALQRIQPMLDEESRNLKYKLQISIGVAEHKDENETSEEFFKRADEALYLVKEEHHKNS